MGKSVAPPTFFRRSIDDPVQLFRDPAELYPALKLPQSSPESSAKTPHKALPKLCIKLYQSIA